MTDFGQRKQIGDASAAGQVLVIAAIEAAAAAMGDANAVNQVLEIAAIEAVGTAVSKLHSQATHLLIDRILFDDDPTTYTSEVINVSDYRKFTLMIWVQVTGTPTNIAFSLELADSTDRWHKLMTGPFGSLIYESTGGAKVEAITGDIMAERLRLYAEATGTDGSNSFQITAKVILGK